MLFESQEHRIHVEKLDLPSCREIYELEMLCNEHKLTNLQQELSKIKDIMVFTYILGETK